MTPNQHPQLTAAARAVYRMTPPPSCFGWAVASKSYDTNGVLLTYDLHHDGLLEVTQGEALIKELRQATPAARVERVEYEVLYVPDWAFGY